MGQNLTCHYFTKQQYFHFENSKGWCISIKNILVIILLVFSLFNQNDDVTMSPDHNILKTTGKIKY